MRSGLRPRAILPYIGPLALGVARPESMAWPLLLCLGMAIAPRLVVPDRVRRAMELALLVAIGAIGAASIAASGGMATSAALAMARDVVVLIGLALAFMPGERGRTHKLFAVSLIMLVLAAAHTEESTFALPFAIFVVLAPAALADAEQPGAPVPVGAWVAGPALLALSLFVFFALPRSRHALLETGILGTPSSASLGERISLDSLVEMKRSSRIALRVWVDRPLPESHKWRGMAFDRFDGSGWTSTAPLSKPLTFGTQLSVRLRVTPHGVRPLRQEIEIEPGLSRCLFAARDVVTVGAREFFHPKLNRRGHDLLLLWVPRGTFRYLVESAPGAAAAEPESDLDRYLALPELAPRMRSLAQRVVAGSTSTRERLEAIERYLGRGYRYELPTASASAGLEEFLFERRAGHCELFASAMVVLARYAGIPARLVDGFTRGELSELTGAYVVRRRDAHAWVEAWVTNEGWIELDPTPAAPPAIGFASRLGWIAEALENLWTRAIVDFGQDEQRALLARAGAAAGRTARHLPLAAPPLLALLALRRRRRSAPPPAPRKRSALGAITVRALRRASGYDDGDTLREALTRAGAAGRVPSLIALVDLHERHMYGPASAASPEERRAARNLVRSVRRELRAIRHGRPTVPAPRREPGMWG